MGKAGESHLPSGSKPACCARLLHRQQSTDSKDIEDVDELEEQMSCSARAASLLSRVGGEKKEGCWRGGVGQLRRKPVGVFGARKAHLAGRSRESSSSMLPSQPPALWWQRVASRDFFSFTFALPLEIDISRLSLEAQLVRGLVGLCAFAWSPERHQNKAPFVVEAAERSVHAGSFVVSQNAALFCDRWASKQQAGANGKDLAFA